MEIPVWQMVREAVNDLGGIASHKEIKGYIESRHGGAVNKGTISCQITVCTVNAPARVHFPQNKKSRKADGKYDFLFSTRRGEVTCYRPKIHGNWEIIVHNGKPRIAAEGRVLNQNPKRLPAKKHSSRTRKDADRQGVPAPENWLEEYPDSVPIPKATWNEFASKLKERFDREIPTTEDSVRYLFFYALTRHGFDPNQIIQEYRYKNTEIDTVISTGASTIALEFKFHKERPNSAIPRPENAGQLFSDFFRLKRFKSSKDMSCFCVYVTSGSMQKYFATRNDVLEKWYHAGGEIPLKEDDFVRMPKTFVKYAGEITPCLVKNMKKNIGRKHHLMVTQIW